MKKVFFVSFVFFVFFVRNLFAYDYTLSSAGMPEDAVITIFGTEYRGVNAQGDVHFEAEKVEKSDVTVTCGGGYGYVVVADNVNRQVNVDFYQLFIPSASVKADTLYQYVMKMPLAYLCKSGNNLSHTTSKAKADKIIFIEDTKNTGLYYIYDLTAQRYIYYSSASVGGNATSQTASNVRMTNLSLSAKSWKILLRDDRETVSIVPGSVKTVNDNSPAWNFTGGIDHGYVLNLYKLSDSNSAWSIIDSSAGELACATSLFSLPGAEYMHRLVACEGQSVVDVDFGEITGLKLFFDRKDCGNRYAYVRGTAPSEEGSYSYTVKLQNSDGSLETARVTLTVSRFLQSPTPMMGWLTWNWFARAISHDKILGIAEGMQRLGLVDAGFNTIVLDDCWARQTSDKSQLTYDSAKFPQGISGFIDACRKVNPSLKVGLYSDAGSMTCENYQPGSYGYETTHISLFDSWGVDMLKYDFCNSQADARSSYQAMGRAVAEVNTSRHQQGGVPFVFNICEWGSNSPWLWASEAGGSSWRATNDARESWIGNTSRPGVLGGVDVVRDLWMYAGVNRFNDLDMMCIGLHGLGGPSNNTADHMSNGGIITGLTPEQARSQMSLWCMLSSPLALTCDLRATPSAEANTSAGKLPSPLITDADIATLTNADIISVNQDSLGQQAEYMAALSTGTKDYATTGYDVYLKDLTRGRKAVAICNRGAAAITSGVTLSLADLYMDAETTYTVKDIWSGEESKIQGSLSTGKLKAYETKVYIFSAAEATGIESATSKLQNAGTYKYFTENKEIMISGTSGITSITGTPGTLRISGLSGKSVKP